MTCSIFFLPQHFPQPHFLYYRRTKSWHKENWKVFVFILAFSVVRLVNHVFTGFYKSQALGNETHDVSYFKRWENQGTQMFSAAELCSCPSLASSPGEVRNSIPIHLLLAVACMAWRKLWDWAEVYNCTAVWPSLTIVSPSRIPVTVSRWFILPNVSNTAVMSEVFFLKARISSYSFSSNIFGVEKLLSNVEPSFPLFYLPAVFPLLLLTYSTYIALESPPYKS